jgi:MoaA/NifB/PqqE/SkfB family radical SAM enzyme
MENCRLSSLVTIEPAVSEQHRIEAMPVVVLFLHNQCNCRCVMCDIWKIRDRQELSMERLKELCQSFRKLGVRWVVLSGGEAQLHSEFGSAASIFRSAGMRVTLLTAGLLLEKDPRVIADTVDDLIVSLDGPAEIHDKIRRVKGAYRQIANGICEIRKIRPEMSVRARCTIQKENHAVICETVEAAKQAGFCSISFLAADLASEAFNRAEGWSAAQHNRVALTAPEVRVLEQEIERLIALHVEKSTPGFVVENALKLRKIVWHFRAHLGEVEEAAPRCNAPWVSAVVETNGDVRPCFFHRPYGNLRDQSFSDVINGPQALHFRKCLDVESNAICRQCVCSLYMPIPGQ